MRWDVMCDVGNKREGFCTFVPIPQSTIGWFSIWFPCAFFNRLKVEILQLTATEGTAENFHLWPIVFTGPVHWTEKRPKSNWTQLQKTGPLVAVAQIVKIFSCQLWGLLKNWKTEKNWSRPVATGLSSCQVLELIHAHFSLIFGLWIIKKWSRIGWDMSKNIFIRNSNICPFHFCHISAKSWQNCLKLWSVYRELKYISMYAMHMR